MRLGTVAELPPDASGELFFDPQPTATSATTASSAHGRTQRPEPESMKIPLDVHERPHCMHIVCNQRVALGFGGVSESRTRVNGTRRTDETTGNPLPVGTGRGHNRSHGRSRHSGAEF